MENFDLKLLKRSIGQKRIHRSIRPLCGDQAWVRDLDIVNELGGHSGCVNALSWSTSGRLLASGSDDTYLNIWEYNPAESDKPFTLGTSVSTGHHANIFSVKFMPHSNDRTVVTCAGDSQVRIFDVEYASEADAATGASESTRSRRFQNFFSSCRWLSEANTNAKVYRSHADRAKRIVTESSPYLFLTCSEDGEVRQWDLRQPSSAYPAPRDSRHSYRRVISDTRGSDNVPPPLISYKNYGLDLNTISCSKHQPHYIALGGAHLHCFLHDRRMLGRDLNQEKGRPAVDLPQAGSSADESMREATKCVRRFAPNNKRKMRPGDHGHITACKISDARPNELIASWSGDHIYSFDIVKGPDARDAEDRNRLPTGKKSSANQTDRKRKRGKGTASSSSVAGGHDTQRLKIVPEAQIGTGQTAFRVQLENGDQNQQSSVGDSTESPSPISTQNILSSAQRQSERIAKALVELRKTLFDFTTTVNEINLVPQEGTDLTTRTPVYTEVLRQATKLLPEMEEVMRDWTYPNTTDPDEIMLQNTLRRNRQSSWRFVQAAGCLSYTLSGSLQTLEGEADTGLQQVWNVKPAALENKRIDDTSRFCYDFVKAILLWLNGGKQAVLEGFRIPPEIGRDTERFPFDENVKIEDISARLHDYLLPLASDTEPVLDLGTNRFQRDEFRSLFVDQQSAVLAFTRALDSVGELRVQQGVSETMTEPASDVRQRIMDKGAAARFWGEKVCRALLMNAAEPVTFNYVNRAFGGLKIHVVSDDVSVQRLLEDVDDAIVEEDMDDESMAFTDIAESPITTGGVRTTESGTDGDWRTVTDSVVIEDNEDEESGDDSDDNEQDYFVEDDSDSESDAEETDPLHLLHRRRRRPYHSGPYSTQRAFANKDVPYSSHVKTYKGHCNTRTVKDVNYYGLDDEYIVSGSDDGNLFIWDRKSCQVVSVLEGDGEVVNVVQGHPYEAMIACSGIDSTIKIFGPGSGSRERCDARQGINIANPGGGRHSSLAPMARHHRRRTMSDSDEEISDDQDSVREREAVREAAELESVSRGGLRSRKIAAEKIYEIVAQNNSERQQGMRGETFLTQAMLTRLVLAAQNGELQGIEGLDGANGPLLVDENCQIM